MYAVYANDVCFYNDIAVGNELLVSRPKLTLSDNAAGSFSVVLPVTNICYKSIERLTTRITITKNNAIIWSGRVFSDQYDFMNNRTLICEGALAFFNDTIQNAAKYENQSVREYVDELLKAHNSKVDVSRQFVLGIVTVEDKNFPARITNHERTIDCLLQLVEHYGGHIRVRYQDDKRYLDYLKDYPNTSKQVIQFGSNLLNFSKKQEITDYATAIKPLGARLDKSPIKEIDAFTTVESVNNGDPWVVSPEAVKQFGRIEAAVEWPDEKDPAKLLEHAKKYLSDTQFDDLELEVSAMDLHYLDRSIEAINFLDECRVVSRPHGLDKVFPVSGMEIPLDMPQDTVFKMGKSVRTEITSSTHSNAESLNHKIDGLPKASNILESAKDNATQIMNLATTGFITITKNEHGSDTLYISNVQDYSKATKLWKWNMNGLGYSNDGGQSFGLAITMDGSIVADYITTGVLNADVIRTGVIRDYGGNVSLDLNTGSLTIKKGSINLGNGAFTVDNDGNMYARNGIFAGQLQAATGTFGGRLQAVTGDFQGVVRASDFQDRSGRSMMSGYKFTADYLDIRGLTVRNNYGEVSFQVDGSGAVTINGNVTMGRGSVIDWSGVSNQYIDQNPAYSKAMQASRDADDAWRKAVDAYDLAEMNTLPSYIERTRITSTTIESPEIYGGRFYGNEFNVIGESRRGSFNIYADYESRAYHMFTIEYYDGNVPEVNINSPAGAYITIGSSSDLIYFEGNVDFSRAKVQGLK